MISTRRIVAAVGLAVGVTAFAAPLASAADASTPDNGQINPMTMLDSVVTSGLPADQQGSVPHMAEQMRGLNQLGELDKLNELHQVTDLVAPVTGLLPAVEA
ncbi:hypothetical protein KUM39_22835 [Streptomyces sp. J2-1]|uniref:hypothetical protein n=1 Tax=Streptomyces corallincola TaxID=2851888 RepID=UPI001C383BE9|nr:hypothetical protein [Streptomyces corallincola]MBV2357175.1 hypothetical protein [Streptomyces corallincola]